MRESRLGMIASVGVHACVIPLLVTASLTLGQNPFTQGPVKVVEADFTLVPERPKESTTPAVPEKRAAKKAQSLKIAAAQKKSAAPGRPLEENRECMPAKKADEPPPEPVLVTASDEQGETLVKGVAATYADASGLDSTLQPHGGTPGNTKDDGEEGGGGKNRGSGQGGGSGGSNGGEGIVEGSRDYDYIRDAIMRNVKYPDEAIRLGMEGRVLLSFVVLENGKTDRIEVIAGSGSRILDESAKEAVAATRIDRRVSFRVIVRLPIAYRLRKSGG